MKRIKIAPYGCILHLTDNSAKWHKVYTRWSGDMIDEGSAGLTFDNWTQSMRESKKLSTFEAGAKMVINGQRIR